MASMNDCYICAYQSLLCMGEIFAPRASSKALIWCLQLKVQIDNCDATVSPKPYWWRCSFFLTINNCTIVVHWFL